MQLQVSIKSNFWLMKCYDEDEKKNVMSYGTAVDTKMGYQSSFIEWIESFK